MYTTTSYPGVYVKEDNALSLSSLSSSSIVPAFAVALTKEGKGFDTNGFVKINSWQEFAEKYDTSKVATVVINGSNYKITYSGWIETFNLRFYFENGGGPCYVFSAASAAQWKNIFATVKEHEEINVLGNFVTEPSNAITIYQQFSKLLEGSNKYFLIINAHEKGGNPDPSVLGTRPDQSAAYYPLIKTNYHSIRVDSKVIVTGLSGASTLAELKGLNNELYNNICIEIDQYFFSEEITIPPTAAIASAYCKTAREKGIWKSPANIYLNSVRDLTDIPTEEARQDLFGKKINLIEKTTKGTVIWGARTLDDSDDWRYISVRLLFNQVERDIKQSLNSVVFQANSSVTWERVRSAIQNYLYSLWKQGGLVGRKEQEAYFVQIGKNITMDEEDIKQGKLIVKVGLAVVRPAEFIILQFTQNII